jgi:hypothetical protein
MTNQTKPRSIAAIAYDIRKTWTRPYFGAMPYIDAMQHLTDITDKYFHDDARSIVRYFLANAGTWRGPEARRIKAELKTMVEGK